MIGFLGLGYQLQLNGYFWLFFLLFRVINDVLGFLGEEERLCVSFVAVADVQRSVPTVLSDIKYNLLLQS